MWRFCVVLVASFVGLSEAQRQNPCPHVLKYQKRHEPDRWTATISLTSEDDLEGIWLDLALDYKAFALINWFGKSTTTNNIDYQIRSLKYHLKANEVLRVKLEVSYNSADRIPGIALIRLNGRTICKGIVATTTTTTTTEEPDEDVQSINVNSNGASPSLSTSQGEFFSGELSFLTNMSRPIPGPPGLLLDVPCGTIAPKVGPLITRGRESRAGDWPWHIALFTRHQELSYICGGTLISRTHVLTAAHCVTRPTTSEPTRTDVFYVFLGRTNLRKSGAMTQERRVAGIVVHPEYNSTYYFNDLAIIRLDSPVEYNDFIRPACLWSRGTKDVVGQKGTVIGWGYTEREVITDRLQETEMPIVSTIACIWSNRNFYNRFLTDKNYCAGYRNGTSVCNGDSGGGMFFAKGQTEADKVWEIRGMVSLSLVLQQKFCDPYNYVVFTDVAHHVDWIKANLV